MLTWGEGDTLCSVKDRGQNERHGEDAEDVGRQGQQQGQGLKGRTAIHRAISSTENGTERCYDRSVPLLTALPPTAIVSVTQLERLVGMQLNTASPRGSS